MQRTHRMRMAGIAFLLGVLALTTMSAQSSLDSLLKPYLAKYDIPALAAAVVKSGKIVAVGAVGVRRVGTNIHVTLDDRFHLGSDTKAMTALLAAMLVEKGKLRWDSTPREVFPELADKMDPVFQGLTLEQLLSHTSGLPSDNLSQAAEPFIRLIVDAGAFPELNLDAIRYWLVKQWAALPVPGKPGERFEYSNLNYLLVGAMIERLEGKSWDELMFERIFNPLWLTTARLGTQSSLGQLDAPLGHAVVEGKVYAYLAGPTADNPTVVGPAGIACMSILDFARWAGWNAGEGRRGPPLVKPETLKKLHTAFVSMPPPKDAPVGTPSGGSYGFGWGQMKQAYHANPLVLHGGSNGKNLAQIQFDPQEDFAVVVLANIAGKKADAGVKALCQALFEKYAKAAR